MDYSKYMEESDCKEEFMNTVKCLNEAKKNKEDPLTKCKEVQRMLDECLDDRSDIVEEMAEEMQNVAQELLAEVKTSLCSKEGDADECIDDGDERLDKFMEGGGCMESYTAFSSCLEKVMKTDDGDVTKCAKEFSMLMDCMNPRSDYYQPILEAVKTGEERFRSIVRNKMGIPK